MEKAYIITCTTSESRVCEFTFSFVVFAFTSKARANKQLDIIKDKIEHGEWWSDCDGNKLCGKILSDTIMEDNFLGVLRDVMIESPNGIHEVFRLQERELNNGIY